MARTSRQSTLSVMVFGVGAFAQSHVAILGGAGARAATYLTRNYGHASPAQAGPVFSAAEQPDPLPLLRRQKVDLVVPQSIDWAQAAWAQALVDSGIPIFCPTGEAMLIERERDYARRLCRDYRIPFPRSQAVPNRLAAQRFLKRHPRPYVIKNPLCSPWSPVHTIACETVEETRAWLARVDYAEGVFLQEYLGRAEAGHIALVSAGEIHSLVTNQEYKRAHAGNLGIVCGAPLGGLVERDPGDKYGLARQLLHPLRPWFRRVNYHGPIQVTACLHRGKWKVIEYNVRLGITSGAMILRMLDDPVNTLWTTAHNQKLAPRFHKAFSYGCSMTLAGYGYPHLRVRGPKTPISCLAPMDCDVWWNEVERAAEGTLVAAGHRIADVVAFGSTREEAVNRARTNIGRIHCLGAFYRTDIGETLWPPGMDN